MKITPLFSGLLTLLVVAAGLTIDRADSRALGQEPTNELALAPESQQNQALEVPGLGDPGSLEKVVIETTGSMILRGPDARHQLLVTGRYSSGQQRDLTQRVSYSASPEGILSIDQTGLVTPQAEGEATILAKSPEGITTETKLQVANFNKQIAINFPNQVVPIFTKLGCNSGGCHGKASGQNGFKLSLLGFEPQEDFEYLVKEGRGRRLFPAAPDSSLLLLKATNIVAHGGGRRLEPDSHEYRVMRRWIAQGMPYGKEDDPTVERIEIFPKERTLDRRSKQQLTVIAHYTDGSTEDVTRMAQYEPNDTEMAEVSEKGVVETLDLTGDVGIMARYQSQVAVFRASMPLGVPVANLPEASNFIDRYVFKKLETLGMPPSQICDDSTFLRRVTVDIAGRLPTAEEAESFLAESSPDKRARLIDRLLDSGDYADYFANKWSAVLRNKREQAGETRGTFAFHSWIRNALAQNMPYDEFVRAILAASGELGQHPPVVWYREVSTTEQQVEDTAQLFLGLRIQCARCHHHPFEKWSQHDYYGFAAFFSRVKTKQGLGGPLNRDEKRVYHQRGTATARHPKTGETLKPTGLGSQPLELSADQDPRHALVDWMAQPENPFFAPALVNRYWKHFFSRGLVDPEDDMRVTNPASHPKLLKALAGDFIKHEFDLKHLVRTICLSKTYQLASDPNRYNVKDKQNFSRFYPRRLNAEVLYDALHQVTDSRVQFSKMPAGMRAVQLPDTNVNNYFLTVFGMPAGDTACECERSSEANLAQSLHLLNSNEVQGKISSGSGRAAKLARDQDRSDADKIRELYLWVYSRPAEPVELQITQQYLDSKENKQQAYEDILWALLNSKEFLFNH